MNQQEIKSVRLLVETTNGVIRRVGKLTFGDDASFYLVPGVASPPYYFGIERMPVEPGARHTFPIDAQHRTQQLPKLSVHESGEVHVRNPDDVSMTSAIYLAKPLRMLRGEHVATISIDRIDALPVYRGKPNGGGRNPDRILQAHAGTEAMNIIVYVNGLERSFACGPRPEILWVGVQRPTLNQPLFVGMLAVRSEPLEGSGMTVLAGAQSTNQMLWARSNG